MSKNCSYLIRSSGGDFNLEVPSQALVGSNKDFEISLYKFMTEHNIKEGAIKELLVSLDKELVIPSNIKSSIVGQDSLDSVANRFSNSALKSKIKSLSNTLTKDWRSKKDKSINPSVKQNIVFCAFDDKYDYEYNKEHDVIFINIAKTVDKNNILRASLERAVSILGLDNGEKSAAQLLKEHDVEVFEALNISPTSTITPSDISYLYFNHNSFNKESVVSFLSATKDTYLQVVDKFSKLSSTDVRNENYTPKEKEFVYNLQQGDLVMLETDSEISKDDSKGFYSLFVDYSINGDGNYVIKAISPNSSYPETRVLKSPEVITRKYREPIPDGELPPMNLDNKFTVIKMDTGSYFSTKFLFNTVKRGDKITIGATDYIVLNIKGSILKVMNSKGDLSDVTNYSSINTVKLNPSVHPNLDYTESNLDELFKPIKFTSFEDRKFIDENDIVQWGEDNKRGIVVHRFGQTLFVKIFGENKAVKIYDSQVTQHYIYTKDNEELASILKDQKSSLTNVKPFEYQDYSLSPFNWVEYYPGFELQRGDIVVQNNLPMAVIASSNGTNRLFAEGHYFMLTNNELEGSLVATNRSQDKKLADSSINKNTYYVSNNPDEYTGDYQKYEVHIIQNVNTGQTKVIPVNSEIKSHYKILDAEIKSEKGYRNTDKLYAFQKNNISVKNAEHTNPVYDARNNFQAIFPDIIPGTFIRFNEASRDLKYWLVERKVKDAYVISHSYTSALGDGKWETKTVKKLLRASDAISELRLPTYATKVLEKMNSVIGVKESKDISTLQDPSVITESQSPELINNMVDLLKEKFNIDIQFATSEEFAKMGLGNDTNAAVIAGNYYLNIDKASLSDPLHEFLHIVLGSMKYSDYNSYKQLVSSVVNHPLFNQVSKVYNDTSFDNLEETFIRLFSDTVSNSIAESGVFSTEAFDNAVKNGIKNMFDLKDNLENESAYDLLHTEAKTVLESFSSSLIDNMESLYNKENAIEIIKASSIIREFIKNGNLNEECNGL